MPGLAERFVTVLSTNAPVPLQREWVRIAGLGAFVLLAGALLLAVFNEPVTGGRWLVGGLAAWAFVLWQCHRRLPLSHGSIPLAEFNEEIR